MTTFQTEGFTVTINTGYCPVESWQNLQKQLYDLLSTIREDNMPPHRRYYAPFGRIAARLGNGATYDTGEKIDGKMK